MYTPEELEHIKSEIRNIVDSLSGEHVDYVVVSLYHNQELVDDITVVYS